MGSETPAPLDMVSPSRLRGLITGSLQRLRKGVERFLPLASHVWAQLLAGRDRALARPDATSLARYAVHLTVLLLAVVALAAGQINLPQAGGAGQMDLFPSSPPSSPSNAILSKFPFSEERGFLIRALVPHTIEAELTQARSLQPTEATLGRDRSLGPIEAAQGQGRSLPSAEAVLGRGGPLPPTEATLGRGGPLSPAEELLFADTDELAALKALKVPTFEAPHRDEIITYVARSGDTVWDIAERFGISPETILWANDKLEDKPDLLAIGQELIILPVSGVYHTVELGETLESIAQKLKVDLSAITDYALNQLSPPYELQAGQKLIVPGGQKPYIPRVVHAYQGPIPENAALGTGSFGWPVSGRITQKYWDRHQAIDIGTAKGNPIYAADSGFVTYAGWSDVGYGYMLIIDHRNGFQTLYAHLSWYYPEVGQSVAKGELIAKVGSTGRSTGPHLHFEIIQNGVKRNPLGFLP
jgi:murein DD-endopeptidase MepM/ murein hydrolase activator NlpD